MKAMTNQRQLITTYNKGDIESVAKDLNLYQKIETDHEWKDNGNFNRRKTFLVKHSKGVARWTVKMQNGNIQSVGCEFETDLSKPVPLF